MNPSDGPRTVTVDSDFRSIASTLPLRVHDILLRDRAGVPRR
jgi:hypothetical protein